MSGLFRKDKTLSTKNKAYWNPNNVTARSIRPPANAIMLMKALTERE